MIMAAREPKELKISVSLIDKMHQFWRFWVEENQENLKPVIFSKKSSGYGSYGGKRARGIQNQRLSQSNVSFLVILALFSQ